MQVPLSCSSATNFSFGRGSSLNSIAPSAMHFWGLGNFLFPRARMWRECGTIFRPTCLSFLRSNYASRCCKLEKHHGGTVPANFLAQLRHSMTGFRQSGKGYGKWEKNFPSTYVEPVQLFSGWHWLILTIVEIVHIPFKHTSQAWSSRLQKTNGESSRFSRYEVKREKYRNKGA